MSKRTLTYNSTDHVINLDNKNLRWKKIKVTCYGGKGGNGGNSKDTSGRPRYGETGEYGEIRELIVDLSENDIMLLNPADNGVNGISYYNNDPWASPTDATGGSGGGASTFYVNNIIKVGASGGDGGEGGKGYHAAPEYTRPPGGWGDPIGEGEKYTRSGGSGGKNSVGKLISKSSSQGKIIIEVLELYPLIKYLIQDKNSILFTFNGIDIVQAPSQTLDEDNFKNNGVDDITEITEEQWNKIFPNKEDIKILMWTDDTEKQEAKLTYECEPFELTDWLKQDGCKLLVYTDDLEKKECEMIYNCEPYKPIDKLKETSDTCKILIKEM